MKVHYGRLCGTVALKGCIVNIYKASLYVIGIKFLKKKSQKQDTEDFNITKSSADHVWLSLHTYNTVFRR